MNDVVNKIAKLTSLCDYSVNIDINNHRDFGQGDMHSLEVIWGNTVKKEILEEVHKRNTMVYIRCYPKDKYKPIKLWHWDLSAALDEMIKKIQGNSQ